MILLLQSFLQFIYRTSSELNIKNGQEREDGSLTDEQKDKVDKINEESQKNKKLRVPNEGKISNISFDGKDLKDEDKKTIYNDVSRVNEKTIKALEKYNKKPETTITIGA